MKYLLFRTVKYCLLIAIYVFPAIYSLWSATCRHKIYLELSSTNGSDRSQNFRLLRAYFCINMFWQHHGHRSV